jgi:hypothetical protein
MYVVDSRLYLVYEIKLTKPFRERGDFPNVVQNRSESIILENPWVNGKKAAPFDQYACFFFLLFRFDDPPRQYSVHHIRVHLHRHARRGYTGRSTGGVDRNSSRIGRNARRKT